MYESGTGWEFSQSVLLFPWYIGVGRHGVVLSNYTEYTKDTIAGKAKQRAQYVSLVAVVHGMLVTHDTLQSRQSALTH